MHQQKNHSITTSKEEAKFQKELAFELHYQELCLVYGKSYAENELMPQLYGENWWKKLHE